MNQVTGKTLEPWTYWNHGGKRTRVLNNTRTWHMGALMIMRAWLSMNLGCLMIHAPSSHGHLETKVSRSTIGQGNAGNMCAWRAGYHGPSGRTSGLKPRSH